MASDSAWAPLIHEFEKMDREKLVDMVIAAICALAMQKNSSPRTVADLLFASLMEDDVWYEEALPNVEQWKRENA